MNESTETMEDRNRNKEEPAHAFETKRNETKTYIGKSVISNLFSVLKNHDFGFLF